MRRNEDGDVVLFAHYLRAWNQGELADRSYTLRRQNDVVGLAKMAMAHPPTCALDPHVQPALVDAMKRAGVVPPKGWLTPA